MKYLIAGLLIAGLLLIAGAAVLAKCAGVTNERLGIVACIALACMVTGGTVGILVGGVLVPPVATESWFKTYQESVVGSVIAVVTILAAATAFYAVQRQIAAQQTIFENERDETRKQSRLTYLRQYVPELQEASEWTDLIQGPLIELRSQLPAWSSPEAPIRLPDNDMFQKAKDDLIPLLNTMPKMPFFPGVPALMHKKQLLNAIDHLSSVVTTIRSRNAADPFGVVTDPILKTRLRLALQRTAVEANWDNASFRNHMLARQVELSTAFAFARPPPARR
jgi:hypothetical protein